MISSACPMAREQWSLTSPKASVAETVLARWPHWVGDFQLRQLRSPARHPSTSPPAKKPQRVEEGTVDRVADGDTLTVITPNQTKLRIRMFGNRRPRDPQGDQISRATLWQRSRGLSEQLVEGTRVKVDIYGGDRYKRLLSTIFIDGNDINLAMIEAGLAEVYRGPESGNPYKPQYQAAEEAARAAKKGMWVLGDQYESPRAYRKRVGIS